MKPRISLQDQQGNVRSLEQLEGSFVVAYFYPKDFTSGCTREACDFRDAAAELASLGAKVVGISRDTSPSHAKFDAKHGLGFTLLSDPDNATAKAWGAW
ncbi:MAG TPA: peroxiredoxin, partial [Polyangiaceae bacterium]|nr:peroxiredoxin [Polyangiaceae bacterium]